MSEQNLVDWAYMTGDDCIIAKGDIRRHLNEADEAWLAGVDALALLSKSDWEDEYEEALWRAQGRQEHRAVAHVIAAFIIAVSTGAYLEKA